MRVFRVFALRQRVLLGGHINFISVSTALLLLQSAGVRCTMHLVYLYWSVCLFAQLDVEYRQAEDRREKTKTLESQRNQKIRERGESPKKPQRPHPKTAILV